MALIARIITAFDVKQSFNDFLARSPASMVTIGTIATCRVQHSVLHRTILRDLEKADNVPPMSE